MPLSAMEKEELRQYVLERACNEFRRGEPCVLRDDKTEMVGSLHAGCARAQAMLALVAKA
jgi:hypothetical protein